LPQLGKSASKLDLDLSHSICGTWILRKWFNYISGGGTENPRKTSKSSKGVNDARVIRRHASGLLQRLNGTPQREMSDSSGERTYSRPTWIPPKANRSCVVASTKAPAAWTFFDLLES
jgi:hypothetical protein